MMRFLKFVLVFCLILAIFPLYTRFKVAAAPVPPGVHLGGLALSSVKETDEIRRHLDSIYQQPVDVRFGDARLVLRPEDVGFQVDADQMVAEAGKYLEGTAFLDIAVRYALGFEQQQRNIPVRFTLNSEQLNSWLDEVAAEYNRSPASPRLLPPSTRWANSGAAGSDLPSAYVGSYQRDWVWRPGRSGQTLDKSASIPIVVEALTSGEDRMARLAIETTPPAPPTMQDLERELNAYSLNFPGFAAAYVHDMRTGKVAAVDADVSFSGMSTLKLAIAAAIMAELPNGIAADDQEADLVGQWLDYALGESNNYAANQLLGFLGDGSVDAGVQRFTSYARELGMVNTYMQSGYTTEVQRPEIPTPGNQRTDWDTNPDSNLQTSTAEMGRILTAIYECTRGDGLLIETFGERITPRECESILFYMSHDEFQEMLWAGLPRPADAWIVHKHGFAFESHSDVALVWGPTGPYVISVFLYRPGWMDWTTSNSTMKDVSRITWNFFAFQREALDLETPEPVILQPPPGYTKLHDYIQVASTGYR